MTRGGLRLTLASLWLMLPLALARSAPQSASLRQPVRPIGVVTQVQAGRLILHTDAGPNLTVNLPEGVSILLVPPGAKNLSAATKIAVSDVHVGDRVLVLGAFSADQRSIAAKTVIVMSKTALAKAHETERLQWEKNGIGGVVKAINPAVREITLAVPNTPPTPGKLTHSVMVALAPHAVLLRYAPDSIEFSDAKPGTFEEIKVGDQVRALGTKSADGSHLIAEELVSGTFLNIGATVISVDAPKGTFVVKDLATGKPLLVRTGADTQLHQLTPEVADTIAVFNAQAQTKGGAELAAKSGKEKSGEVKGGRIRKPSREEEQKVAAESKESFEQILRHMPLLSLNQLKPGQPLIVVSTEGARPSEVTAIAVLSGVGPILRARPKGAGQVALGPWNLSMGGASGGAGERGGNAAP